MQQKSKQTKSRPGSNPAHVDTDVALPVPAPLNSVSAITTRTVSEDPRVIFLDHSLEEKFEGRKNVRTISCGVYELPPDHRVRFCVACLPHDAIDDVKQWGVS